MTILIRTNLSNPSNIQNLVFQIHSSHLHQQLVTMIADWLHRRKTGNYELISYSGRDCSEIEVLQLYEKSDVRVDLFTASPHMVKGLVKSHFAESDQVSDRDCWRSRNALVSSP